MQMVSTVVRLKIERKLTHLEETCKLDENGPLLIFELERLKAKAAVASHVIQDVPVDEGEMEHLVGQAPSCLAVERGLPDWEASRLASLLVRQ